MSLFYVTACCVSNGMWYHFIVYACAEGGLVHRLPTTVVGKSRMTEAAALAGEGAALVRGLAVERRVL